MSFHEQTVQFLEFLSRSNLDSLRPMAVRHEKVGIVVTPWVSTPLPWYAITLGLVYKLHGYQCTILWDDLEFDDHETVRLENKLIEKVLDCLQGMFTIVRFSQITESDPTTDELSQLYTLSKSNVIWKLKTSVTIHQNESLRQFYYNGLAANYKKIRTYFCSHRFDHIVCPGGVYGNSGLYLLAGRTFDFRVATYDCGNSMFFIGLDDVACYFYDDVAAFHYLMDNYGLESPLLRHVIKLAQEEFERRLGSTDRLKFQTVAIEESMAIPDFDVLIPLSIDWDAPGLGRNRFFNTPAEWALETAIYILEHSDARVVIRYHPYNRYLNANDHWEEFICANLAKYGDRMLFITADAKVNSYDLLRKAKVVLPYVSTIGIEAVFFGKPVVIESNVHFSDLPFVAKASSRQDYFDKIMYYLSQKNFVLDSTLIDQAYIYYYIFQVAKYLNYDFTPQPTDFTSWVQKDLTAIASDENTRTLMKSLIEVKPVALHHIERSKVAPAEGQQLTPQAPPTALSPESMFPMVTFGNLVQIIGMRNIQIGEGTCIGDNTWLNICVRDENIRMRIGKSVLVGRQSMISTGGYLEIGDYCVFAPRVYISDADHLFEDIQQPILQQGATLGRSVIVEENCWFGINTVISGNLTVGRGSVIGANAVVTKDIPPFSVVVGNPARIVKMYNPVSKQWEKVASDSDRQRIEKDRARVRLPSRQEHAEILRQRAAFEQVDPLVAGNGACI